jgi:hypothetical protein
MDATTRRGARLRRRRSGRAAPARVARRGAWTLARLVNLVASVVAGIIVVGILLVVLEAHRSNDVVNAVLDAARFLAGPFKDIFSLDSHKATTAVNWGIAAAVYLVVGGLIARLLRR